ncbi:hypothetical protein C8Q77DRAFT_1160832 [Trametes polyzona]|nr:hypothetical protein C8Q77DRAFT_1160832 [Trametes polyzona]
MSSTVPQSVDESLLKGGIDPKDVETVGLSDLDLHWDHIGDAAAFPNTTFSDIPRFFVPIERTRGPFPRAHDYLRDRCLYLIDAAGHLAGHLNVLARTSGTGLWTFFGTDFAHDVRLLTGEKKIAVMQHPSGRTLCVHADKEEAAKHIRRVGSLLGVSRVHMLLSHDVERYEKNTGGVAFLPGKIPLL